MPKVRLWTDRYTFREAIGLVLEEREEERLEKEEEYNDMMQPLRDANLRYGFTIITYLI